MKLILTKTLCTAGENPAGSNLREGKVIDYLPLTMAELERQFGPREEWSRPVAMTEEEERYAATH